MKVFSFDVDDARRAFEAQGYAHLVNGVTPEFLAQLRGAIAPLLAERPLDGPGLAGAKDQFLYELPPELDVGTELFDVVAAVTGLTRPTLTLSERHIKAYFADADPDPVAHKDRLASTIALGVTVAVADGSHVVLWPDDERDVNPFMAPHLRPGLDPEELPEVRLAGARAVEIHDAPGDVLLFWGASTWHLRRRSAGTVLLYLKFNDFDSDPMGEDPDTPARRAGSLALLEAGPIDDCVVRLSRRFESVLERHRRPGWEQEWLVQVWDAPPFPAPAEQIAILKAAVAPTLASELWTAAGLDDATGRAAIQRLVCRDALELFNRAG